MPSLYFLLLDFPLTLILKTITILYVTPVPYAVNKNIATLYYIQERRPSLINKRKEGIDNGGSLERNTNFIFIHA